MTCRIICLTSTLFLTVNENIVNTANHLRVKGTSFEGLLLEILSILSHGFMTVKYPCSQQTTMTKLQDYCYCLF